MSRSNPNSQSTHPCTFWGEWKGGDGRLTHHDKDSKEDDKNVTVPLPFRFMVLDILSTVTGYNKREKCGITANEVRDVRTDILHVKFHKGADIASGAWKDVKEKVNYKSGAYAQSVYIAYKDGDTLKIGNIRISGCALSPWIAFKNANQKDVEEKGVVMVAGTRDTSGSVEFTPPEFSIMDISKETNAKATELDKTLQEYLKGYLDKGATPKGSDKLPGEEDYSQERPATEREEGEPRPEDLPEPGPGEEFLDEDCPF